MSRTSPHLHLPPAAGLRRLLAHRFAPVYLAIVILVTVLLVLGHQTEAGSTALASLHAAISKTASSYSGSSYAGSPEYAAAAAKIAAIPDPLAIHQNFKWYTDAKLRNLAACMAKGDCPANAAKVVIFNCWYCYRAIFENYWGGEGVWCRGMKASMERQGYTVLYTNYDWEYAMHIYRQIPDLVVALVSDDDKYNSPAKPYLRSEKNPDGLPAWKHFRFNYYAEGGGTRIGDHWVITCEPEWIEPEHEGWPSFRNFSYIGYSLEPQLQDTRFIPFEERPMRAYVLGKHQTFFYEDHAHVAWKRDTYKRALDEIRKDIPDFEFVGAFFDERGDDEKKKEGPLPLPEGIRNIYPLNATAFDDALSSARMLVGIGWPTASPSPYRALARGVPFLSPFKVRDDGIAEDPYRWSDSQHDSLRLVEPPLVYNVEEFDYNGFVSAIKTAMVTPIEPYVFPRMTRAAMDERIRAWLEADWESEAKYILAQRKAGHETQKGDWVEMFDL